VEEGGGNSMHDEGGVREIAGRRMRSSEMKKRRKDSDQRREGGGGGVLTTNRASLCAESDPGLRLVRVKIQCYYMRAFTGCALCVSPTQAVGEISKDSVSA
jgi:hypothetical protein